MPRGARLDIPGLLQHVIVRGIEKRPIFSDDHDRQSFFDRFSRLLQETETDCLAWALIPNHFHLLLRPNQKKLAVFMRRLLTGYAVSFNRRHQRVGHLFQNRYKSIVCQQDAYLLELVRYIHLNPLRAGLVSDLAALDHYSWSGHAALMGNGQVGGMNCDLVLTHFGYRVSQARGRYRKFVGDGIALGQRDDLVGKVVGPGRRAGSDQKDCGYLDNRILGGADFTEKLCRHAGLADRLEPKLSLIQVADRVAAVFNIDRSLLLQPSKVKHRADARSVFCYLAVRCLGYKGTEVGRLLGLGRSAVCHAVSRGERLVEADGSLQDLAHENSTIKQRPG